ncbi:hypothetical protein [Rhodococcus sp. NCIMB 12038]|uniref:hypothetical protein n=1 Tax=Rhodococcus sp. NCIMB 12038 TaxID=933800 RepID=UPI000B3C2795|nr:hypothetical protein [Rhodococcus sp. NCIMB 12038]OUS97422.1 hypothetical protein CA951_03515 [Rhodococcus sp. NCIMB 12038]
MLNHTALTLIFVLVLVATLGAWGLTVLLLQASRDAAVEELVAAHACARVHSEGVSRTGSAGTEEHLIQQIRRIDVSVRERYVLVGRLAVLILLATSISYFAIRAFAGFLGM